MTGERKMHLSVVTVIDYYDGPLLFTAVDQIGTVFLCTHIQFTAGGSLYVAVAISQDRLDAFLASEIDLRSIYTSPESEEYYLLQTSPELKDLIAVSIDKENIPGKWLPLPGYFVSEPSVTEPFAAVRAS